MPTVTQYLDAAAAGDSKAAEDLLPLVYDELRQLAAIRIANERSGQTLQATALVHEAYLRVVGPKPTQEWKGRGHFFAAAAEAMRRILVETARGKQRLKRGGERRRVDLEQLEPSNEEQDGNLLALDEALDRLAREDAAKAELVKLRYFAGLSLEEAAACQGISLATAKRRWAMAKAWLYDAMTSE